MLFPVIYRILPIKNTLHITISKLENKVDPDQLASNDKFVCFDALHPSQQFFSHVGIIFCLPMLKQY